jgi:hypothetical protein
MDPPPTPPPQTPTITDLFVSLQNIIRTQQDFRQDLNTINTKLNQLRTRLGPPGFIPTDLPHPQGFANTSIKLDIPRFDGTEALGWIFKINQFFEFHRTPKEQRLNIASFYMEGEALNWYQWMHSNGSLHSWLFSFMRWSFVLLPPNSMTPKEPCLSCVKLRP